MRMYDIMLFLALLGAVSGAVSGLMGYSSETWFPDYNAPDMETIDVPYDTRFNMADLLPAGDEETTGGTGPFRIIINTFEGVFAITSVISNVFYPGQYFNNPLTGFFIIFQVGIWLVYAVGIIQVFTRTSVKSME